jgi:hypothetical protein
MVKGYLPNVNQLYINTHNIWLYLPYVKLHYHQYEHTDINQNSLLKCTKERHLLNEMDVDYIFHFFC